MTPRGRGVVAAGVVFGLASFTALASANKADVIAVEGKQENANCWVFAVTVRHDDRGAEHWADWWRVRTPEGKELGRRVLLHSHEDEQPFTRDERVCIPAGISVVVFEAHDKVHGLGGATVTVDLTRPSGPNYTLSRLR